MTSVFIIKANGEIVKRTLKPWEEVTVYARDMTLVKETEEGDIVIIGYRAYIHRRGKLYPIYLSQ